ncbi:hypothetical protein LguiA_016875 [Lonicera macranthoides]
MLQSRMEWLRIRLEFPNCYAVAQCCLKGGDTEVDYDDNANQVAKNMQDGSSKGETKHRARRSQTSLQKIVRKQLKKAISDATEYLPANGTENLSEVPSITTKKRKGRKTLKINDIDENIRCQVTLQMPVKKRRMQGQYGTSTSVACRTRQCMGANQAKRCGDASSDLTEGMNMTGSGGPKDKRKRCRTGVDAFAEDTTDRCKQGIRSEVICCSKCCQK